LLGARVAGQWTGDALGARLGAGLELGRVLVPEAWPRLRLRAVFEPSLAQDFEHSDVSARVSSWPLRIGLDVGVASGAHAALFGVATGLDLVWTTPERAGDPALTLSAARMQLLPSSRAELRYELALQGVLLSAALFVDVPWKRTHYDVVEDGQRVRLATPWRVRPGLALGCGARL